MNIRRFTTLASILGIVVLIMQFSACEHIAQVLSDDDSPADEPTGHEIIDATTYAIKDLPIEDISAAILEGVPTQVNLHIKGHLTDSCTTIHQTTEWRQDNAIHVQITTKRPIDLVCATVVTEIEHIVPLGAFDPGEYQAIVNGFVINFTVN